MELERLRAIVEAIMGATCDCLAPPKQPQVFLHKLTCTYRVTVLKMVGRLLQAKEDDLADILIEIIDLRSPTHKV